MKSDSTFVLEHAAWPALLVDGGGVVRRANAAAIEFFGPKLEGETTSLSALLTEGSGPAEKFLALWERQASPMLSLKFRGKGAAIAECFTCICHVRHEDEQRYLLQLLGDKAAGSSAGSPESGTKMFFRESSAAQKPKLDRAMQLTRTVALDFNNALTSIVGHTALVLARMESDHPWRKSLMEVRRAADKAADIAHQLAVFSRQDKEAPTPAAGDLNDLLRRVAENLQQTHGAGLTWDLQLESPLYQARFDDAKLEQAFVRLLENALEATTDHGRIGIESRNLDVAQATYDGNVSLNPGAYVCVEITDDGLGIEAKNLPRVFEPFFTTKSGHRGLGLVWVYGIATNLGGGVAISSQPGQGTSVRVYLPATKKILLESVNGDADLRGSETILVVDDEDLLLNLGKDILTTYGYQVLTAESGAKALEVLASAEPQVDLVITDLVMPQMSGRDLVTEIQRQHPGLPVICTSGFAGSRAIREYDFFLEKPFTPRELLGQVKTVLRTAGKASM